MAAAVELEVMLSAAVAVVLQEVWTLSPVVQSERPLEEVYLNLVREVRA